MSFWQAGGGPCCGAPNCDMPPGDMPDEPGIPGIPPNCAAAGQSGHMASASASGMTRLGVIVIPLGFDSTPRPILCRYVNNPLIPAITRPGGKWIGDCES